jgi:hypothetical protein
MTWQIWRKIYSAAKFKLIHVNSHEFTIFHTFSREFTKKIHTFSHFFTKSSVQRSLVSSSSSIIQYLHRDFILYSMLIFCSSYWFWNKSYSYSYSSFFYRYGRQTKLKIASYGLFHKKSFIFPIRRGNMDCFEYENIFVKKPMRGYF